MKLPSGEVRKFSVDCMATVGQVGNLDHENETFGKAGRTRWLGIRPTVRGVAMNPVDHPHGGGEGRVKGNHPQTPWAFPTLGKKTRTTSAPTSILSSAGSKTRRKVSEQQTAKSIRGASREVTSCEWRAETMATDSDEQQHELAGQQDAGQRYAEARSSRASV